MRLGWTAKDTSARLYRMAAVASVILLFVYILIYWFQPFSEFWNNFFSNFFLVIASGFAALVATLIWRLYDKTDSPRLVWRPFAIGLWLWFVAELTWGMLNLIIGDVEVGLPDIFWVTAYFILGLALLNQYRILFQLTGHSLWRWILLFTFVLIILTLVIYGVFFSTGEVPNKLDVLVNSFYPAADILLVCFALWLARKFTGGALARPWLGLLVFAFADFLYAWLQITGTYAWSIDHRNLLSAIADISYLVAYIILGMGVLYHWLFLKYGLRSPAKT
jgi:hypothetical protein